MDVELVGFSFAINLVSSVFTRGSRLSSCVRPGRAGTGFARPAGNAKSAIAKAGQKPKYDMSVLARYGVAIEGPIHDTMLQSYVLNSVATRHNMDALAGYYLDRKRFTLRTLWERGQAIDFNQVPLETAADYAADADVTLQLHHCLLPQLQAQPRLLSVYTDIDMPLVRPLSRRASAH